MQPYYTYGTNLSERNIFTSTVKTDYGLKRYFSNIESEIYFGNEYMEDIVAFDFYIHEVKTPIFGYNSHVADAMLIGRRYIEGSFAINFLKAGNVTSIINNKVDKSLSSTKYNSNYTACGKKAIWNKPFDILIGFGYHKGPKGKTYNSTGQCLLGVIIEDMQQAFDASGEPILEIYKFKATDYQAKDFDEIQKDLETNDKEETVSNPDKYRAVDIHNEKEKMSLMEYCKSNPSTVGFMVDLKHNISTNTPNITLSMSIYDNKSIDIHDVQLDITDQRVHSPSLLNMSKLGQLKFKKDLGTDKSSMNNEIKKALKNGQQNIKCTVSFRYTQNNEERKVKITNANIYKGLGY